MPNLSSDRRDELVEAGLALTSQLSLPLVLERIVELACRLTGAQYGALGVLGPGGTITDFITHGLSKAQRHRIGALPVGRGILGCLLAEARPLRLVEIASDPRSVGFPPHHPPMTSFLGAPVRARGQLFGNIYLTNKRGDVGFSDEDERALVVLASQAGLAIANATLYEEAVSRERWLSAAQAITNASLAGASIKEVLSLVVGRAGELMGGWGAAVAMPGPEDGGRLRTFVISGPGDLQLTKVLESSEGAAPTVLRTGRPMVTALPPRRPRGGSKGPAPHPSPLVLASIAGPRGGLGVLGVIGRPGQPPPPPEAVRKVQSFAAQAAMALEYEQTQQEHRRLLLLDERERIAKELHDGVIQSLFAVGMGLQALVPGAHDPEIERRIELAASELDQVIGDLRAYIFALRPGILGVHQLGEALHRLALEFEARSGVGTKVEIDDQVARQLADHAPDLVQLTREALSNVGRHAGAHSCWIRLVAVRAGALLAVRDDGAGFAFPPRSGGQGLRNMQERVVRLGGHMTVRSQLGSGTRLRMVIPLG